MKFNKTFLLFSFAIFVTLNIASSVYDGEVSHDGIPYGYDQPDGDSDGYYEEKELPAGRRLLASHKTKRTRHIKPPRTNCRRFPSICPSGSKSGRIGSPSLRCCHKRCVDLLVDRHNCGACGKKCKYNETCCGGKCVNPLRNSSHCGGCHKGCGKGDVCAFGLCNYA